MPTSRLYLAIAAAWTLFWVLMVSVAIQDYVRNDSGQHYWQPVLWESSSMLVATFMLLVQRHFTRGTHHLLATPWRWFAVQALWLPVYWLIFTPMAFGIRHGVYALLGETYRHRPWAETFFYESLKITVFVGLFIVIRFGILSYMALLEQKLQAEKANALLRQAQLQQLTQQMQPHFLFNALNTISSLMHSDVARADATLIQLADVLRTTLDVSAQQQAPLATELRLVQGYAGIMLERFGERVRIDWRIDDDTLACKVPVMSIQPLLENVFKHTVERQRGMTQVLVSAQCTNGALTVRIDDDCGRLPATSKSGIGTGNLRERLAVMYGAAATLTLSELDPAGVRAEMRLPCAC